MKRIGVLYIATGPYIAFWKDFYESFEKWFLNDLEVHYYVFTDCTSVYMAETDRVHVIYQKAEPWPLATLLKFHRFLEVKEELLENDYLYQSNANIICVAPVTSQDFLPREEKGEKLLFTVHPGYMHKNPILYPYERRHGFGARIPYFKGKEYVFGAMNGGASDAYIDFITTLDIGITQDLKSGKIARWHDESWVNKGIQARDDYRLLGPEYCYPVGMQVDYEPIIMGVPKQGVFDVDEFKGRC